jgi:hypothetical protein
MTDDIPSLPEAEAELRARFGDAAVEILRWVARDLTAFDEIRRLRARIAELEAASAITLGTLEPPTDDEPARYTHDVPPSAPPHKTPSNPVKPRQTETPDE